MRYPINPKTPIGFAIAAALAGGAFTLIFYAIMCAFAIFVGYFAFVLSIFQDIHRKLMKLMDNFKDDHDEKRMLNELGEVVHITSDVRELSTLNQGTLFRFFNIQFN